MYKYILLGIFTGLLACASQYNKPTSSIVLGEIQDMTQIELHYDDVDQILELMHPIQYNEVDI